MNCGTFLKQHTVQAVAEGKLDESKVDESLSELYRVLMRLGFFDGAPDPTTMFGSLNANDVCTEEHKELALDAARQGIVLLKNDNATLPLSRSIIKSLAIIGPNANVTSTMIGNYAGKLLNNTLYKTTDNITLSLVTCLKIQNIIKCS